MQTLKKRTEGFTIIEVMIVLVIAAVIILLVFLAVPALQRNSRNVQRKNDVSKLLAGVTEWASNNNGALPVTPTDQAAAIANSSLGIYKGAVSWGAQWPTNSNTNAVVLAINAKCSSQTAYVGQNRSVAALYYVETGQGTPTQQCASS